MAYKKKKYLLKQNRFSKLSFIFIHTVNRDRRVRVQKRKIKRDENIEPAIPNNVVSDMELIEIATQAGLNLEKDIHLFLVIEDVV